MHYEKDDPRSNYYGEWFDKFFYKDFETFKEYILGEYYSIKAEEKTTLSEKHYELIKGYFDYISELTKIDPELVVTAFAL